ncbi:hypothetical protein [Halorarum salinum]|uniref:Uncharacterized protein n=1 Tax=Halorarum salinum TaxID=2743089 RepID=A0A7D5LBI8_9EURY|nr:hypothetical protein [Halobaculum salinum]QLG62608.1 hypothetical protein HUG12_13095 [Halobaculum salinum]
MTATLDDVLAALEELGYGSVTRTEGYDEAGGTVPLPEEHRAEPRSGWRRLLPRLYDGGDPALVPDDLRAAVEERGWVVQPMGRSAETATVVVSRDGV